MSINLRPLYAAMFSFLSGPNASTQRMKKKRMPKEYEGLVSFNYQELSPAQLLKVEHMNDPIFPILCITLMNSFALLFMP